MNAPANPQAKRHIGQILIDQGILTEDQLGSRCSSRPSRTCRWDACWCSSASSPKRRCATRCRSSACSRSTSATSSSIRRRSRCCRARWRGATACSRSPSTGSRRSSSSPWPTPTIVAVDQLRAHLNGEFEVELRLSGDSEIERAIEHYYGHEFSIDGILRGDRDRRDRLRHAGGGGRVLAAGGAPDRRCSPTRSSAAPRTSTSSRSRTSCASATASTACCARSAACTRPTGRRWRCASR